MPRRQTQVECVHIFFFLHCASCSRRVRIKNCLQRLPRRHTIKRKTPQIHPSAEVSSESESSACGTFDIHEHYLVIRKLHRWPLRPSVCDLLRVPRVCDSGIGLRHQNGRRRGFLQGRNQSHRMGGAEALSDADGGWLGRLRTGLVSVNIWFRNTDESPASTHRYVLVFLVVSMSSRASAHENVRVYMNQVQGVIRRTTQHNMRTVARKSGWVTNSSSMKQPLPCYSAFESIKSCLFFLFYFR